MGKIKTFIKDILLRFLPLYQWFYVKRLRHKKKINVVFFASSLPMWRYQHLYEALSKHPRFNVNIVIMPFHVWPIAQQNESVRELCRFFDNKSVPYLLASKADGTFMDVKSELDPDLLFYPQPYKGNFYSTLEISQFYDRLLCYYPYAFWRSKDFWSYNLPFHNRAWKLFYSTELHRIDAKKYANNKGRNVEVVGYPTADDFLLGKHTDVWKHQTIKKKRVVWAPHFTLFSYGPITQSNFLWMSELMLYVAKHYSDKLQLAFKPHPRLFSELTKHPDWGEKKAEEYYNAWASMENTQLETGEFVDLFMTSDAMIHDSGSFCVEYHYSGNPVMYVADNFEEQVAAMADFGKLAMQQHYVGRNKQDIIDFIENTVIGGIDPMKPSRAEFVQEYLVPPNGKSVVQNTMDILLKELC